MTTKSSLRIIWTSHGERGVHQDEVPGMVFYGYWDSGVLPETVDQGFSRCWQSGRFESTVRRWPENNVLSIETRLVTWPAPTVWLSAIERCLHWFVECGAIVSWCGDEMASHPSRFSILTKPME